VLNRVQDGNQRALNPVLANPLVNGQLVSGVTLNPTGTPTTVAHGLGRSLKGWLLVRKRGTFDVYDAQDSNPQPAATLILNSTAAQKQLVSLWVF
jgi:hypothetical protein